MLQNRASGIVLHISSLPSNFGIGDLGPAAYEFVDFLNSANQKYWQILPLNPSCNNFNNSPYSTLSAFAGNTLFISPQILLKDGLLQKKDIEKLPAFSQKKVNYTKIHKYKATLLKKAYDNFKNSDKKTAFKKFCNENKNWLDDFALFIVLKEKFKHQSWSDWPKPVRDRQKNTLSKLKTQLNDQIDQQKFFQFIFFGQWYKLKKYCSRKNIKIIGDLPIYVAYESADLWANPELFKLDKRKKPSAVGGVPPDYFSKTGQLWNNPVYKWDVMKKTNYKWWLQRYLYNIKLFDLIRMDHFRGFAAYWQVNAKEKNAVNGTWIKGPGRDIFDAFKKASPDMPIIAEDLGFMTPDVEQLINDLNIPGMKILQFAFKKDLADNRFLPHNYEKNCVVYTGTHDNNTIRGWYENEAKNYEKKALADYLDKKINSKNLYWEMIKLATASAANLAIIPMQDLLNLPASARMNRPATTKNNWQWRLLQKQADKALAKKLARLVNIYSRI